MYLTFVDLKPSDEKKKTILRDEYNIELTHDMKEELNKMGGLMEPAVEFATERATKRVKAEATTETKKQTLIDTIRKMMKNLNLTVQQAMNVLEIPADKQKEYADLI